ncbi:copper ABC transporter permease [Halobacteriales archaeon QH_10_67_22]|nr:MAG: copper ABC transporter permease [Halobacteriales archaeon QH_10_67_22]
MTWAVIAKQDARTTVGARSVKVLLGLLAFVVLLFAYIYPVVGGDTISTARFPGFVSGALATLVPLVALLLGYNAVAGERESGAVLLSLSLPHSRRDLVLGKYVSRTGLVAGTLLVSLVGAGALVVYPFGELDVVPFLAFVLFSLSFTAVWSGLGVAVSLAASTKRRALVAGFALFFLFVVVWDAVTGALQAGLTAVELIDGSLPDPLRFVVGLEPGRAFGRLVTGFVDPTDSIEGAWYLSKWVSLVVLELWVVGPMALAFLWFDGRDLS